MLRRNSQSKLKARLAWEDARDACHELLETVELGDRKLFRRRWVSAITLLRAVGNVLKGADCELHPLLKQKIDAMWQEPKPPIFTGFIEEARNLTVKEYRSNLFGRWECSSPMSLEPVHEDDNVTGDLIFMGETFKEKTLQELLTEALDWWDGYLARIERELKRIPQNPPE